ncbi:uncharacterized protein TNCV_472761 [Trichonephila clavipes]|nr:uncharacterized protein TNCV_472761 [Trichonephila clavipes]
MVIGIEQKITNFFIPELNNHDVQELWFQQDGATCHTARATIDLLKDTFGDRLISRFGPVNWPPRSCDLTPLDYFLWGYVKSLIYADKPQTLDHLEDNIRRVIADIRPQMLEKIFENWTSRLDYIRASRGSPMPEIIFNMEEKRDSSSGNDEQNRGRRSPFPFTLPPTGYSVQNRASVENDPDNNSSLASGDTELEDDHRDAPQVEPPPFPGPFRDRTTPFISASAPLRYCSMFSSDITPITDGSEKKAPLYPRAGNPDLNSRNLKLLHFNVVDFFVSCVVGFFLWLMSPKDLPFETCHEFVHLVVVSKMMMIQISIRILYQDVVSALVLSVALRKCHVVNSFQAFHSTG